MSSTRQLAAIMFTDIAGYTALMGADEKKAMELVRRNKEVQKPLVEKYKGTWLKEMGDGAMSSFTTASDAIYCAMEIQKALFNDKELNLRIGIHLGEIILEEGDIYGDGVNIASRLESIAEPGGIYISDSVQKAIRSNTDIQSVLLGELELKNVDYPVKTFALRGEFLPQPKKKEEKQLSGTMMAELQRRNVFRAGFAYLILAFIIYYAIQFLTLSPAIVTAIYILLSIGLPLSIYMAWNFERSPEGFVKVSSKKAWTNPYSASQKKPFTGNLVIVLLLVILIALVAYPQFYADKKNEIQLTSAQLSNRSIAILPFENLSNDPEQVYFADGMAEMIRTRLSKLKELKVTSMRSVIQYRDSEKTVPEIAGELGVAFIIEGSVFKLGDKVRAVVQLIDPSSDDHIWSESFEGSILELFDFQSKVAVQVADALKLELLADTEPEIKSSEVYNLILAANHNMSKLDETRNYDFLVTAAKQFQKAYEFEPGNEYALIGLGRTSLLKSFYGKGKNWLDTASYYAQKVYDMNPDNADANLLFGHIYGTSNQLDKAEEYFRRTIEIDPNNSNALSWLAELLQSKGNFEEAIRLYLQSVRLDPNNPERARYFYSDIGYMMVMVGMDEEAEKSLKAHQNLYPDDRSSYSNLSWLYLKQGRKEEARAQINEYNKLVDLSNLDDFNRLDGYAWSNDLVGNYEEARPVYRRQYEKTRGDFQEMENAHHIWRHRYAAILWQDGKIDSAKSLMKEHISLLEKYVEEDALNGQEYDLAGAYAFMGDRENAYKWLEKLPNNMFTNFHIQIDPMFDSLRNEKKFQEILGKIDQERDKMRMTMQAVIASEEMKDMLR